MPKTAWKIDWSEWPVAGLALERRDGTAEPDFATFLAASDDLLRRRETFALVINLAGNKATAERRAKIAAWYHEHKQLLLLHLVAVAVVAESPVERGVVTAMAWLIPPPVPVSTFAREAAARVWAKEQLRAPRDKRRA